MRPVEEVVAGVIAKSAMIALEEVKPEATLSALGLSSLDYMECVMSVEDALEVEISESNLWNLKTVQDVIDAVKSAADQSNKPPK